MRRMPEDRRLSSLVEGGDPAACLGRLAKLIATFHERAPTGDAIDAAATRDAVAELSERELAEYPGSSAEIAELVQNYLAGRVALFDARIAANRARDGHGDLLADDVFCLPDGPRVLDCLDSMSDCASAMLSPTSPFSRWTWSDSVGPTSRTDS